MKSFERNIEKGMRLAVAVSTITLVGLTPISAYADEANLTNNTTGADSNNVNSVNHDTDTNISTNYDGSATNSLDFDAYSGHNDIANNTTVGNVTTGSIKFNFATKNVVNSNNESSNIAGSQGSLDVSSSNERTGADSDNRNNTTISNSFNYTITKEGDVDNNISFTADTGHNRIKDNTTVGDITTGNILANFSIENYVNSKYGVGGNPDQGGNNQPGSSQTSNPTVPVIKAVGGAMPQFVGGAFFPAGANLIPLMISLLITTIAGAALLAKQRSLRWLNHQ